MSRSLFLSLAMFLAAGVLAAQESPDQQARRLLENGREYRAQGKLKQALDNFTIIVSSFPETDSVGQALLEIGRYRLEVDGDAEKARTVFERVTKEHARSDAAPGAYYHLGLLTLERAVSKAEIDDALAQFTRVETLYPHSSWVPRALQGAARAHRRAGRYVDAADLNRRVSLEYPASDAAAVAQFEIGQALALQGEHTQAMEEFQQVRSRFPESEWAQTAIERITALYRLFEGAKPVFAVDPSFSLSAGAALKDVKALLWVPGGSLWIASGKTDTAVLFAPGSKMTASYRGRDPRTLALGPRGQIVFTTRGGVRIGPRNVHSFKTPPEKPGAAPKPVHKLLAGAVVRSDFVLVSDDERDRVLRYDDQGQYLGTFPANDRIRRKVTRILVDAEGNILTLDRDEKVVRAWDANGRVLRVVGPAGMKSPVDIAVDSFGNLYVADEDRGVLVFDARGQLLTTIGGETLKPSAVTLDASGAVLVADSRKDRVLRFH